MEATGISTAIMLAVAAGLWFLYFMPTWMRRREYLATERTATRLQQTMRVLAETAEVPDTVRVEASAREAARQERLRLAAERQATRAALREADEAARAAREIAAARAAARPSTTTGSLALERMRRTRRGAGVLLLAALVTALVQLWLIASTGAAAGSWLVLAAAAAAGALSVAVQGRIRARILEARGALPVRRASAGPIDVPLESHRVRRDWTPVPLPKPLYVEHPEAPRVRPGLGAPTMDAAALLRAASAEAERALRDAGRAPEVVPLTPRTAPAPAASAPAASAPSRFARMGIVDASPAAAPDLDEVLRRRRNVG